MLCITLVFPKPRLLNPFLKCLFNQVRNLTTGIFNPPGRYRLNIPVSVNGNANSAMVEVPLRQF